ncbi:MAG TPA: site-2 protease family protein [Dehalococcoidales bacterium]|nr:site-2 protease family protein [Dehalococcoidales bacterium]
MSTILWGLAWYFIFVISATFHEAAHAWAAKRAGDLTAYSGGQVSLNPVPHMKREPWGMIILPLIAVFLIGWPFGYASTPYSVDWAQRHPRRAAWMGCMGPLANLFLVLVSVLAIKAGIEGGVFLQPTSIGFRNLVDPAVPGVWTAAAAFISLLFSMNLILMVLNLFPLPPFDGSNIIALILPAGAARGYSRFIRNPILGFGGFLIAWFLFRPLFQVIFPFVVNLIYPGSNYS